MSCFETSHMLARRDFFLIKQNSSILQRVNNLEMNIAVLNVRVSALWSIRAQPASKHVWWLKKTRRFISSVNTSTGSFPISPNLSWKGIGHWLGRSNTRLRFDLNCLNVALMFRIKLLLEGQAPFIAASRLIFPESPYTWCDSSSHHVFSVGFQIGLMSISDEVHLVSFQGMLLTTGIKHHRECKNVLVL